jgi:tetratricopeptide (TPR) repeat protein
MVQLFKKHFETESPTVLEKLLAWGEATSARVREQWQGLREEGRWAIPKPALVGIPLAVIVAFLLLLLSRHERSLAEFASIEPVPYQALQIRSGASADEGERLFEEGMAFYVQKDYSNAMAKLALAARQDSAKAGFHFYLGLCYLLSDSVNPAIVHLQRAIALGGNSVLEKAYWYLGNAWLLKSERDSALEAFRKVVELEEDYQWEAQEIIAKIERLSRN